MTHLAESNSLRFECAIYLLLANRTLGSRMSLLQVCIGLYLRHLLYQSAPRDLVSLGTRFHFVSELCPCYECLVSEGSAVAAFDIATKAHIQITNLYSRGLSRHYQTKL